MQLDLALRGIAERVLLAYFDPPGNSARRAISITLMQPAKSMELCAAANLNATWHMPAKYQALVPLFPRFDWFTAGVRHSFRKPKRYPR
jgi:hypothetical protein